MRLAAEGTIPRRDYVEVATALDADVVDSDFVLHDAGPGTRRVADRFGVLAGVLYEAAVHRRDAEHLVAWSDRGGIPAALLYKWTAGRRDLALVSVYMSQGKKAFLMRRLRAHSHLGAIIFWSTVQRDLAADRLGVPRRKLHTLLHPVDDRFWTPVERPREDMIMSVGWEARDYPTLTEAVRGLPVRVDLCVGTTCLSSGDTHGGLPPVGFDAFKKTLSYPIYERWMADVRAGNLPANVHLEEQLEPLALREKYARARFVVVPLHDVEFDAGVTAVTEAMAMGRAVVVTRSRAQVDVLRHGEQGLYVPPGDPAAMRDAIRFLLDHPEEAERMGRAGRALVEAKLTLDGQVVSIVELVRAAGEARAHRRLRRAATVGA
jgi:glycosyltransferase involved in cell wall biosynthesis